MAKTDRIRCLDEGLREYLAPKLEVHGFRYDARTRTFRRPMGECTQIIEMQVGARSAEGTFAVNLAVYHPLYNEPSSKSTSKPRHADCLFDFRKRLGALRNTWRSRIFKRLWPNPSHWLTWWLTSVPDKWWPFSATYSEVEASLHQVSALLEDVGLIWLEKHSDLEALRRHHAAVSAKLLAGSSRRSRSGPG